MYEPPLKEILAAMNDERQRHERLYRLSDKYMQDALTWAKVDQYIRFSSHSLYAEYDKSAAFAEVIDNAITTGQPTW